MTQEQDQKRHEELLSFIKQNELLSPLAIEKRSLTASGGWKGIDTDSLNNGAELLKVYLNLVAASSGDFDLYELLQVYFKDEKRRSRIFEIVQESK